MLVHAVVPAFAPFSDELFGRASCLEAGVIALSPRLQTIAALPSAGASIDGLFAGFAGLVDGVLQTRTGLAGLDDETVTRLEQTCREHLLLAELYQRQLGAWRRIYLNAAEAAEIDRLEDIVEAETAAASELLAAAGQYRGNVRSVSAKSASEAHLERLLESIPAIRPHRLRPRYAKRDVKQTAPICRK